MSKRFLLILAVATSFFALGDSADRSIGILRRRGLKGAITVFVSNSSGEPIADAEVNFYLQNGRGKNGFESVKVKTDSSGKATGKGRIQISAIVDVRKGGYHRYREEFTYLTLDPSKMDGDRWKPYEKILQVTLLEKRHETAAQSNWGYVRFPVSTNDFWVYLPSYVARKPTMDPSGRDIARFRIHWECDKDNREGKKTLSLESPDGGGFLVMQKGEKSTGMVFPYEYPTNGYAKSYCYETRWKERVWISSKFDEKKEFLAFKLPFLGGGYIENCESYADRAWAPKWIKKYAESNGGMPVPEFQYGLIYLLDFGIKWEKGEGIVEFHYICNVEPDEYFCEYDRY